MAEGKVSTKALTAALRKLAAEAISIENDGSPVTRYDRLAALLWDKALGGTTETLDDDGNKKRVVQKPESWAMQYIFERLEGKSPAALPDSDAGVRASDRVRELAKERLNKMATAVAGPPKHKPKNK